MSNFAELLLLSTVMGLSIFLSMPLLLRRSNTARTVQLLTAAAIGILIFLMADIWGDVVPLITNPNLPYLTYYNSDTIFLVCTLGSFLGLYAFEHRAKHEVTLTPASTALVIALAIGFQNLTEGLVFGATWAAGTIGLLTVIFVGFFLQNVTEGFPITSPFMATQDRRVGLIALLFLIGGVPTIAGGAVGYFYNSPVVDLVFDSLAIGTILYAILPMLKVAFRPAETPEASYYKQRLTYLGIALGFAIGFLVNAF